MKTYGKNKVLFVLGLAGALSFNSVMANDSQYLDSDPIDVNGYVQTEVNVTDAELENVKNELSKQKNAIKINKEKGKTYQKLSRSTEKLADVTEEMIEERKESQETIDKYNKKIDCLMNDYKGDGCDEFGSPKQDKVSSKMAAPQVETEVAEPISNSVKVLPFVGLTTFVSDNENLEASFSGGVKVESDITRKFSVGGGFGYTSLTSTDYGSRSYINSGYYGHYNDYYNGREVEYKKMNLNLYGKYFITSHSRFRPYIGGGLGYNRTTLEYTNNSSPGTYGSYNYYNFGNEEVVASTVNLELMVGSEVSFTEQIGMNVEFNYTKGIGQNISSENGISTRNAPDQKRLEDLSAELSEAHVMSLFAGMLVRF